jgi:hypothetical protein
VKWPARPSRSISAARRRSRWSRPALRRPRLRLHEYGMVGGRGRSSAGSAAGSVFVTFPGDTGDRDRGCCMGERRRPSDGEDRPSPRARIRGGCSDGHGGELPFALRAVDHTGNRVGIASKRPEISWKPVAREHPQQIAAGLDLRGGEWCRDRRSRCCVSARTKLRRVRTRDLEPRGPGRSDGARARCMLARCRTGSKATERG